MQQSVLPWGSLFPECQWRALKVLERGGLKRPCNSSPRYLRHHLLFSHRRVLRNGERVAGRLRTLFPLEANVKSSGEAGD